jgi:hypothetical protein
MQVKVDKHLILDHYHKWFEENPTVIHPLTAFMETLGLRYRQLFRNESWICDVVDKNKYLLAKIKYGI